MYNNLLILFAIVTIINSIPTILVNQEKPVDYELECVNNSGKWIKEYNECEYIKKDWCKEKNGVFDECASACRHNTKSEMCIMVCVPVCRLK